MSEKNGGLNMQRSNDQYSHLLSAITMEHEIGNLVAQVSHRIYEVSARHDNNQFFCNWYTNSLDSYFMDFTGPSFSGEEPLRTQYEMATNGYLAQFGGNDISFVGGTSIILPEDLCGFFCVPPSGPPPMAMVLSVLRYHRSQILKTFSATTQLKSGLHLALQHLRQLACSMM